MTYEIIINLNWLHKRARGVFFAHVSCSVTAAKKILNNNKRHVRKIIIQVIKFEFWFQCHLWKWNVGKNCGSVPTVIVNIKMLHYVKAS